MLLFFVAACGGDSSTGGDPVTSDLPNDSTAEIGAPVDIEPLDIGDNAEVPPPMEDTGAPEADYPPCIENSDCSDGWCVEGPDGNKVCTETCVEACPKDWKCDQVTSVGSDTVFICMPRWLGICRPCDEADDCPLSDSVCHGTDEDGRFCASRCLDDADCPPADYVCVNLLCVTTLDDCPCDGPAVEGTLSTTCSHSNDMGTCLGERTCLPDGLTACSAATATEEVCDGMDNNCDDVTDEGTTGLACSLENEFGSCEGTTTCEAAALGCKGTTPAPELCDGIDNNCDGNTDEGSADTDEDGLPDCIDPDIDDDTILNDDDNCPETPNVEQDDLDEDGDGDACDNDDDDDTILDKNDNCPKISNLEQKDTDNDGLGDVCDDDMDGDNVTNDDDNCPEIANPDQEDLDEDGVGDVCTDDMDGDGVPNNQDNCPNVPNSSQENLDQDNFGDICDDDDDGDGDPDDNDCAPLDGDIHHQAVEMCNGVDDNCDGDVDETDAIGCTPYYADGDGDGFGDANTTLCACEPTTGWVTSAGDCNDATAKASPNAVEACDDMDNNCDGSIDEAGAIACTNHFADQDKDGFGDAISSQCLCAPSQDFPTKTSNDCDDADGTIYPGGQEVCGGTDEDCDGTMDEADALGCVNVYLDNDEDGFGQNTATQCLCKVAAGWSDKNGDCNDQAPNANPIAPEICDQIDNNCDSVVDEPNAQGCITYYADGDSDGYGHADNAACQCGPTAAFPTKKVGDCNEGDANTYPGATEVCGGGDEDCDNQVDEKGASGCDSYFVDADKDGFGEPGTQICLCGPDGANTTKKGTDCDDTNASIYPGSLEVCGGGDEDCDNQVDELNAKGCTPFYLDKDGDQFGQNGSSQCMCKGGPGWASKSGDCNDQAPTAYPGSIEVCDQIDNDCNTVVDDPGADGCVPHFADADADGYGGAKTACLCAANATYPVLKGGDCNDADPNAYPGALETCGGGDEDCDGKVDETGAVGCQSYFVDADKDGYGKPGTQECLCDPSGQITSKLSTDCDDTQATTHPGAKEICGGGDENCNQLTDEENALGCLKHYKDADGDNWGNANLSKCLCKPAAPYVTQMPGDCDDTNEQSYPNAPELCDFLDNDCDLDVDEGTPQGCALYFVDVDGDGFAADVAPSACKCGPSPPYTAQNKGDCNDSEAKINPLSNELCDGWDNNCNKLTDEGYADTDSDGTMDCVDLDDDGDATPDVQDCQPLNAAIPSCMGKECGTDGCGASCGTCQANGCLKADATCMALERCQTIVTAEKSADSQWKCTGCGDVDFAGQCWGDYVAVWCADGVLTGTNCAAYDLQCLYSDKLKWYGCG